MSDQIPVHEPSTDQLESAIAPLPSSSASTPEPTPAPELTETPTATAPAPANHDLGNSPQHSREPTAVDAVLDVLMLPSAPERDVMEMLGNTPEAAVGQNNPQIERWLQVSNLGRGMMPSGGVFSRLMGKDDTHWTSKLEHEGKDIGPAVPKIRATGKVLTGPAAALAVRQAAGLGTLFQVPLYHSGFYLTLKTPADGELLNLLMILGDEKVQLGNATYGLMLSSVSSYAAKHIFDFVQRHIYSSTLALAPEDQLADFVLSTDLQPIILGMARATWPNGFRYSRACSHDLTKCSHIVTEVLALEHLLVVNKEAFTPRQKAHMAQRGANTMSKDQVNLYREEFLVGRSRKVDLVEGGDLSMELRVPTVNQYLQSSAAWLDQITNMYDTAMKLDPDQRRQYLQEQSAATDMRQYTHFVKSLTAHDQTWDFETQQEVIDESLNTFSADDNMRNHFVEQILMFIEDATVALVALPGYKCPSCGQLQTTRANQRKRFPDLIALDANRVFFTLLWQKVSKIQQRAQALVRMS